MAWSRELKCLLCHTCKRKELMLRLSLKHIWNINEPPSNHSVRKTILLFLLSFELHSVRRNKTRKMVWPVRFWSQSIWKKFKKVVQIMQVIIRTPLRVDRLPVGKLVKKIINCLKLTSLGINSPGNSLFLQDACCSNVPFRCFCEMKTLFRNPKCLFFHEFNTS